MVKNHTTWPKAIPHGYVVCLFIPHDTYQMLYHVICQILWHKVWVILVWPIPRFRPLDLISYCQAYLSPLLTLNSVSILNRSCDLIECWLFIWSHTLFGYKLNIVKFHSSSHFTDNIRFTVYDGVLLIGSIYLLCVTTYLALAKQVSLAGLKILFLNLNYIKFALNFVMLERFQ